MSLISAYNRVSPTREQGGRVVLHQLNRPLMLYRSNLVPLQNDFDKYQNPQASHELQVCCGRPVISHSLPTHLRFGRGRQCRPSKYSILRRPLIRDSQSERCCGRIWKSPCCRPAKVHRRCSVVQRGATKLNGAETQLSCIAARASHVHGTLVTALRSGSMKDIWRLASSEDIRLCQS